MHFIDSHAHLADPAFDVDREDVIRRAREGGAAAIVSIGESIAAADRAASIAATHPRFVYHTAGVHPHDAADFDAERDLEAIRRHAAHGAVAVGECGLDYHYDHSPRDAQRRAFEAQLQLAAELNRPVVVHTREADDDVTAMIVAAGESHVRGVLHCFTGPRDVAEAALRFGWYVSFSGIVTFKNAEGLREVVRELPLDRLLVETDAPYLAPVPHRGRPNEPAFLVHTARKVADVKGLDLSAVARATTDNFFRLFAKAQRPESLA